ncbi:MAG: cation:proton antiporter, partial [Proteobacteria bacterium]|nr:cation:proton antiporter [Pseudomonadota bacterium]
GRFDWMAMTKIAASVAFLAALIWFLSSGRKVRLPLAGMVAGHMDLRPLAAVAFCFGTSALSGLLGLSAPYGAFLAGLIIGNSTERRVMVEATRPIQSILMMIFFLSIGLLIDLPYVWANLGAVLMLFFLVTVFKTALNVGILRALGQSWQHAFLAGIMLAQIGEFSFLLSIVGVEHGIISRDDSRVVVAVTAMSLALSPLWVITARRLRDLAAAGITSLGEILRLIYRPEVDMVADTLDETRLWTTVTARRVATFFRRRQQRMRAGAAAVAKKKAAVPRKRSHA